MTRGAARLRGPARRFVAHGMATMFPAYDAHHKGLATGR